MRGGQEREEGIGRNQTFWLRHCGVELIEVFKISKDFLFYFIL